MNTYIGKNKFQFITDFSKHAAYDTNGKEIVIDFNTLTIYERIMLSSYLTILCDYRSDDKKLENIYNKIFNFNYEKKYVQTSYHDMFLNDLTMFLKKSPEFFHFIKDNFDKIENEHTFIFRQQLNATEMDLLYSLKFQKSYKSLMNVLYIMGVAKQNIKTSALNKIPLNAIYSTSPYLSKKRVEEIFNKINSVSKYKVEYKIYKNVVYFGNGFSIEEDEKFYSENKKETLENLKIDDILNSFSNNMENELIPTPKKKEEIKEIPIIKEELDEFATAEELINDLNINMKKDTKKVNPEFINKIYKAISISGDEYLLKIKDDVIDSQVKTNILRSIIPYIDVNTYISKNCKNFMKVINYNNNGEDWKEVKDNAKIEKENIKIYISNGLNKVYSHLEEKQIDNIDNVFNMVLSYILLTHKNILTTNI